MLRKAAVAWAASVAVVAAGLLAAAWGAGAAGAFGAEAKPAAPAAKAPAPPKAAPPVAPKPAAPVAPKPAAPEAPPLSPEARQRLAELQRDLAGLFRDGRYEESKKVLHAILALAPADSNAWYNLACAHSRLGETKEALECLGKAIDHGFADLAHMEADEDLEAVRKEKGYEALKARLAGAAPKAPALPPALEKARKIAAINRELFKRFQEQKYDECKTLLDEILVIDPDNAVAHYNVACVYARTGKGDEAVRALTTSIEKGYAGLRHMERDPDLDSIRALDGYKAIVARKDAIQRERAEKIHEVLKARLGEGYLYEIDHENRLVFATNVDQRMLEDLRRHLTAYGEAQRRDLFTHGFEQYVTVVIPKPSGPSPIGGYYSSADHMLVARTVGMTLVHEFTHALHAADQEGIGQEHPIWVTEGLATLFESSSVEGGHAVPEPNRRANTIQDIVRRKKHVPWATFFKYGHPEFMREAMVAYPEARYILMYFYDRGLLKTWYDAYIETYEEDASGAKAVEKAFAKPLKDVEADWTAWVKSLQRLPTSIAANHAYLGLAVVPVTDGLRISSVVPGSGAEKAGLQAGDVVIQIEDQRVIEPEQLMRIVSGEEVGAEVRVHFRRDGKYEEAIVVLGAKPAPQKKPAAEPKPAEPVKPAETPKPADAPKPAEVPKPAEAPVRKAA